MQGLQWPNSNGKGTALSLPTLKSCEKSKLRFTASSLPTVVKLSACVHLKQVSPPLSLRSKQQADVANWSSALEIFGMMSSNGAGFRKGV